LAELREYEYKNRPSTLKIIQSEHLNLEYSVLIG
jgi:hypothetical protein